MANFPPSEIISVEIVFWQPPPPPPLYVATCRRQVSTKQGQSREPNVSRTHAWSCLRTELNCRSDISFGTAEQCCLLGRACALGCMTCVQLPRHDPLTVLGSCWCHVAQSQLHRCAHVCGSRCLWRWVRWCPTHRYPPALAHASALRKHDYPVKSSCLWWCLRKWGGGAGMNAPLVPSVIWHLVQCHCVFGVRPTACQSDAYPPPL